MASSIYGKILLINLLFIKQYGFQHVLRKTIQFFRSSIFQSLLPLIHFIIKNWKIQYIIDIIFENITKSYVIFYTYKFY